MTDAAPCGCRPNGPRVAFCDEANRLWAAFVALNSDHDNPEWRAYHDHLRRARNEIAKQNKDAAL